MPHNHNIIDTDNRFSINPVTRAITTRSEKLYLAQYDHESERYTFQIPRYIEEHDMIQCDRVEIHFTNITRNKKEQFDDVYIVNDLDKGSDFDTAFFSWLVSSNATRLVGTLKFWITFLCFNEEGAVTYKWSTNVFDGISILEKPEYAKSVIANDPDLIWSLKNDILNSIPPGGEVDSKEVEKVVIEYLEAHPPAQGEQGPQGEPGEDGYTPVKGVDYFTEEDVDAIVTEAIEQITIGGDSTTASSIDAEKVYFSSDLVTTHAIGNIKLTNGQAIIEAEGKNLKQVWDSIFIQEKNPTITQPSVSLTVSEADVYEVGTKVTPSYSASLKAGSYTYGPATGVTATAWEVTDTAGNSSDTASGSFPEVEVTDDSSYSITATATHGDGTIPVTNLGNEYSNGQIKAGTKSATSSIAITGYRNSFYGTLTEKGNLTSDIIRGLTASNEALVNGSSFNVEVPIGALRVVIAYPATLQDLTSVKDSNFMSAEIVSAFILQTISVEGANNYDATDYKVYTMDFANANDTVNTLIVTI